MLALPPTANDKKPFRGRKLSVVLASPAQWRVHLTEM